MSVLLAYASITPGLRITDLLPYVANMYGQFQSILRKFHHLLPFDFDTLNLDSLSAAGVLEHQQENERFGHFIRLVDQTLSSGCLTVTSLGDFAITEGRAAVNPGDRIWTVFGCPTPIVLRRAGSCFVVVSPAYIQNVMDGQTVDGVVSPDKYNEWPLVLRDKQFGPGPEFSYVSGKRNWLVQIVIHSDI
jgi:hypothetical protein